MEVLTPALMLGSLGVVFALLLTFAANKFAVETDERLDLVREALPGANCGACGYPGCDALADAIVKGEAPTNACPVGGAPCAEAIAEIMGVAAAPVERKIARVICQGTEGNTHEKYDYDGIRDCAAVSKFADGQKTCRFACLGFGNCVEACQFGAISIENGLAKIDQDKCTSCGQCVQACPRNVIRLLPDDLPVLVRCRNFDKGKSVREVCQSGCISCLRCGKTCEQGAITFENNLPVIDYSKCIGCKKCVHVCASHTIMDLHYNRPAQAQQPPACPPEAPQA